MIRRLDSDDVWLLGEHIVTAAGNRLYGRAEMKARAVRDIGLQLDADSQFRRHVNIVGWSADKGERKLQAQKLAKASHATLFPGLQKATG